MATIKIRRLKWAGHVARSENVYVAKRVLEATYTGVTHRGRPNLRLEDGVEEDSRKTGVRN